MKISTVNSAVKTVLWPFKVTSKIIKLFSNMLKKIYLLLCSVASLVLSYIMCMQLDGTPKLCDTYGYCMNSGGATETFTGAIAIFSFIGGIALLIIFIATVVNTKTRFY